MPRNASGTYSLPSGNPVSAGTLIDATWANNTLNDLANEMTDSLSRSGEGGMLAPFRLADGLQSTPGIAWSNEPSTGFYRAGTNEMWAVVGGTQITQFTATGMAGRFAAGAVTTPSVTVQGDTNTGIYFPGADQVAIATGGVQRLSVDASGGVSVPGTFSVTGNVTIDTNTLFVDAANNRVGVGTVTPAVRLDVAGGISIQSADNLTWGGAYGATTPAISGAAGFLAFYPNGSTSGEQLRLTATALGVGTATPTFGSGSGVEIERAGIATLRLENSAASNSFELYADSAANGINLRGRDSSPMNFWTGNTSRMTLDASGNLGIGTSSPAAGLHVANGNVRLTNGSAFTSSNSLIREINAAAGSSNQFVTSSIGFRTDAFVDSGIITFGTASGASTPTERMRLDASGNLGLGVTPSAWGSGIRGFQSGRASLYGSGATAGFGYNYWNDGTNWKYTNTDAATFIQCGSTINFYTAPSGTAGNNISFTEAMKLDTGSVLSLQNNTAPALKFNDASGTAKAELIYRNSSTGDFEITNVTNFAMLFKTNNTERCRITAGGFFKASNTGTYDGVTQAYHELVSSLNSVSTRVIGTNANMSDDVQQNNAVRSANSAYDLFTAFSGNFGDTEFALRGDGNGYADGTWNNNGADYAEYFESATGGALTVGATVVLEGNKVREATASDPASAIMGVVRPKEPSKASMVVGNTAWNKWANKYLTDDFDRYIMEDHDVVEWTDEDGKQHSYESHNIPDGVTVPADAVRKTHDEKGNKFQHYKLNPAWDKDAEYTPREKRDEWVIIGLVGQVKVLKGKPVNDRWIKMRDVSAAVEEWMIR